MPRAKKYDPITDQLDFLDEREMTATLTNALRDQGYFEGATTSKEGIRARKLMSADITIMRNAGMYSYFYLMYLLIKQCRESHIFVTADESVYDCSRAASLLGLTLGGVDPDGPAPTGKFKPVPSPIYCAEGFKHRALRAMMMPNRPDIGAHIAIGYSDTSDVPGSVFGLMVSSGFMNNHDGMLDYKGISRYFYFKHTPRDIMSDFVCYFVKETRTLNVIGVANYLTQVNVPPDQYPSLFPTEWYAALLRDARTPDERQSAAEEAVSHNELVLLPHINLSRVKTWVTTIDGQRSIILGLSDIEGIDEDDARAIIAERSENGDFIDQHDFISRCQGRCIGYDQVRSVIHSGASLTDESTFMRRCFQYNSTLYSHVYKPSQFITMSHDGLIG